MAESNTPKNEDGLLNKALNALGQLSTTIAEKSQAILGSGSRTEKIAENLTYWIGNIRSDINDNLGNNPQRVSKVIDNFLKSIDNEPNFPDNYLELEWGNGKDKELYHDVISYAWSNSVLSVLHNSLLDDKTLSIGGKRRSQTIKKHINISIPTNVQAQAYKGFKSAMSTSDDYDLILESEIKDIEGIFTGVLNLILRLNIFLDNTELSKLITNFLKYEKSNESNNDEFYSRALCRIAFLIEVSNLDGIKKLIDVDSIVELIKVKIRSDALVAYCVKHSEAFMMSSDKSFDRNEKGEKILKENPEAYEHGKAVIQMFSDLTAVSIPLKKKNEKKVIQREILENILGIRIDDNLAEIVFDEESLLYALIFMNIVCTPDNEGLYHKFSTNFKTFLLKIITKYPKIEQNNEDGNSFSSFYSALINLEFDGKLDEEKKQNILSFLNGLSNINKNMDFCLFIILGGLEDIDLITNLSDEDREFILTHFKIESSTNQENKVSCDYLRQMSNNDLTRLQSLNPKELSLALQDIDRIQAVFTMQNLRDTINHDLQWIPRNISGFNELENIIKVDNQLQDINELQNQKNKIYGDYGISELAQTHQVIFGTSLSDKEREQELEIVGEIYSSLGDIDNASKRGLIHEIYELTKNNKSVIVSMIQQNHAFDFSLLISKINLISIFIIKNDLQSEKLKDVWELFIESLDQSPSMSHKESDYDLFTEVFGEQIGLRILVLNLPNKINEAILNIGSRLTNSQNDTLIYFIESKLKQIKINKDINSLEMKLQRLLDFSLFLKSKSNSKQINISKYFQQIWSLDIGSNIIQEISQLLYDIKPHEYPLLWDNIFIALLEDNIISLEQYLEAELQEDEGEIDNGESKEHKKLASIKPREVEKKILALGFHQIQTNGGHNKYRGFNKSGNKTMLILPISKGDTNKYIVEQIIGLLGITITEWEEL